MFNADIEEYFHCQCLDFEHTIRLTYFKDLEDDNIVYLTLYLRNLYTRLFPISFKYLWEELKDGEIFQKDYWETYFRYSIFNKFKIIFNYFFNKETENGIFDCIALDPYQYKKFISVLNVLLENNRNIDKKENYKVCRIENDEYVLKFCYANLNLECDDCNEFSTEIHTEIQFKSEKNIFKKIWKSIKYLFGYKCRNDNVDCYEIRQKHALILKNMMEQHLKKINEN
jgi:hypothetical protein